MPASDAFPHNRPSSKVSQPATYAAAVTPHDTDELSDVTRALFIGGAGDVAVVMKDGDQTPVVFTVPAGTILPLRVRKVRSTGTDATNIVAIW